MADQTDLGQTAEAWADIVIKNWRRRIARMNISSTGDLVNSFQMTVHREANGDPRLIEFAFNYYGKFVDMGVGRGVTIAETPSGGRRPRNWYSKEFFSQVKRLAEIMKEKYETKATLAIVENIEGKK